MKGFDDYLKISSWAYKEFHGGMIDYTLKLAVERSHEIAI